ncbi:hypothetical protein ABIB15_002361 [Marisediminicola sp. UYEF4]|uniref:acyl-CoA carboxylase subunit epsilon n=1 Tax=Marisediminicola sp. UYEF4 TaxID=1756384 RepID=UPI0033987ED2
MITVPEGEADAEITILAGDPSAAELAAITAVVTALAEELSDDALLETSTPRSAWQRSQRALRQPLAPGSGAWRSFSG